MRFLDSVHPHGAHSGSSAVFVVTIRVGAPELETDRSHVQLAAAVQSLRIGTAAGQLIKRAAGTGYSGDAPIECAINGRPPLRELLLNIGQGRTVAAPEESRHQKNLHPSIAGYAGGGK